MNLEVFKEKKVWLFDLDNTIYSPTTKIFDQIDQRMKLFISKKLSISENDAFILQKKFYHKYGTTLYGLMKNYKLDPDEFLNFVHDIDLSKLKKNSVLFKKINNLPGSKIIYTNGEKNGLEVWYYENGQKQSEVVYENNKMISKKLRWDAIGKPIIY